jgi:hypothetical protein
MKPKKPIETLILNVRSQKVILDADLAELYGVPTKVFNQTVKRNFDRFPKDFAFQLTAAEVVNLRSQFVTSSVQVIDVQKDAPNSSQIATSSYGGRRYRPYAFTEHGAIMAARPRIPKGFRPSAQGCEERATLGNVSQNNINPNGVASAISNNVPQPRWGCEPSKHETQGSSFLATLGCETQSLWDWPVSAALPISQP